MNITLRIASNTAIGLFFVMMMLLVVVLVGTIIDFINAGILTNVRLFKADGTGFMLMVSVVMLLCYVFGTCIRSMVSKGQ